MLSRSGTYDDQGNETTDSRVSLMCVCHILGTNMIILNFKKSSFKRSTHLLNKNLEKDNETTYLMTTFN